MRSILHELFVVKHIVIEVSLAIGCSYCIVETVVCALVGVCQLHADQEVVHFQVVICSGEWLFVDGIVLVLGGLTHDWTIVLSQLLGKVFQFILIDLLVAEDLTGAGKRGA